MITSFTQDHAFLSNFYPHWLRQVDMSRFAYSLYVGHSLYNASSVEHLYQAMKCTTFEAQLEVLNAFAPWEAKRLGRRTALREDWLTVRIPIMRMCLEKKFEDPRLRQLLLETGTQELIEGNRHGDMFWGQVKRGPYLVGLNWLGRLLMELREQIVRH